MVGPTVKIDPRLLPRQPNIHYIGQRPYSELPRYLRGWDVCLMPFARNRAAEFISPTKTLEYMAAEKPIVSTPIKDVAAPYGDVVYLGGSPAEFVSACQSAPDAPAPDRTRRQERMREVLNQTSWDSTVHRMDQLIGVCIESKRKTPARSAAPRPVIIGAGPTNLSAAYHLGSDSILLEQNSRVYPFQGSLYGLPPAVIKECIVGAIEARFGPPKSHTRNGANGKGTNGSCNGNVKDCCADGILEASAALIEPETGLHRGAATRNFEQFIYKVWGAGIARHFAIPYNRKLWAVPLSEMETSWLGGRVPLPDLEEMIDGALSPAPKPMGPHARFGYPLWGGFQALMDAWVPTLKENFGCSAASCTCRHRATF